MIRKTTARDTLPVLANAKRKKPLDKYSVRGGSLSNVVGLGENASQNGKSSSEAPPLALLSALTAAVVPTFDDATDSKGGSPC